MMDSKIWGFPFCVRLFIVLSSNIGCNAYNFSKLGFDIPGLTDIENANETRIPEEYNISLPLPYGWEDFCHQNQNTNFTIDEGVLDFMCLIDQQHSGYWSLHTLRDWIAMAPKKYIFTLVCLEGSKISLPWPIKARNLIGIATNGCVITQFFNDVHNPTLTLYPNELTFLRIQNSVILIQITKILLYMQMVETMPKEYTCGPYDTVEELTFRNLTYDFTFDSMFLDQNETFTPDENLTDTAIETGGEFLHNTRKIPFVCTFSSLKYIDNSFGNSKSRFYSPLLAEKSVFPKLLAYNGSFSNLNSIGHEFADWRRYYPNLRTLDLSHNNIREITFEAPFDSHNHVLQVNLTYNNITEMNVDIARRIISLQNVYVQMRRNPLNCECSPEMKELVKFIKDDNVWKRRIYNRYSYFRTLECDTPISAKGVQLIALTEELMSCENWELSLVTIICFSIVIVVLIVIIIVMAKFRREIQILTYTRFNILLPCQSSEPYQNKKYDAFVSYSNSDEIWVQKTFALLEDSEQEEPNSKSHLFRFCLHQRDFIAGRTIFDNIIQSVESSRHTVIVLSRSFLQSQWCMYEFQEAFQQSILERKRHLIVVLVENIPESELPKDLRRCLKTFTYIHKDDTIFLDRLVYALSHKGRRSSIKQKTSTKDVSQESVFDNAAFESYNTKLSGTESNEKTEVCPTSSKQNKIQSDENMKYYEKKLCNKVVNDVEDENNRLNSMSLMQSEYCKQVSFEPNINNHDDDNFISIGSDISLGSSIYNRNISRECNTCSEEGNSSSSINTELNDQEKNNSIFWISKEKENNENDSFTFSTRNPDQVNHNHTDACACLCPKSKVRLDSGVSTDNDGTATDMDCVVKRTSNMTTDSGIWTNEPHLDTRWSSSSVKAPKKAVENQVDTTTHDEAEIFV